MADVEHALRDVVGDALLSTLDKGGRRLASLIDALLVWLRRSAEPPRGLELRSVDGASYTGLALFEKSVVIAMLAVRHEPEEARVARPEPHGCPSDGPLWRERPTYR